MVAGPQFVDVDYTTVVSNHNDSPALTRLISPIDDNTAVVEEWPVSSGASSSKYGRCVVVGIGVPVSIIPTWIRCCCYYYM